MPSNLVAPYVLAINDSSSDVSSGHTVRVYNRTTQELIVGTFDSEYHALVDLANFTNAITEDDILDIKVLGKYVGATTHTVSLSGSKSGGVDINLTTAASPSSLVAVSL